VITEIDRRFGVAALEVQPIMAEGLRVTLAGSGRYSLLEPAASLDALSRTIAIACPRVALVDKSCGIAPLTAWLAETAHKSATAVVVWGLGLGEMDAVRLLNAGAMGVLARTADAPTLLACLDNVCRGMTWMEDGLFRGPEAPSVHGRSELTFRERQVLELIEQGMRNKQIAAELGIQPGTVKIHVKHIFEKTGIRGRFGLALSGWKERSTPVRATA
jgi:two-component system, NarL family, nitrate/nitrite response regulator NarL